MAHVGVVWLLLCPVGLLSGRAPGESSAPVD